jgi:hypothetical protein
MIEYRNIAKIVLFNKKKEFLLQLRDDNPDLIHHGEWVLFGGGIDLGENLIKGLERELSEELPDCSIKDIQFICEENYFFKKYNLKCHVKLFGGKIEEEIEYINKKLTEGQKAEYFSLKDFDKIKLNVQTKKSIYKNINKIFKN